MEMERLDYCLENGVEEASASLGPWRHVEGLDDEGEGSALVGAHIPGVALCCWLLDGIESVNGVVVLVERLRRMEVRGCWSVSLLHFRLLLNFSGKATLPSGAHAILCQSILHSSTNARHSRSIYATPPCGMKLGMRNGFLRSSRDRFR